MNFPGGSQITDSDIVFKIDKPLLILGHPLIGFAVIIGKADKVAGVRVMEADFAGKAAYIGNFQ